MNIDIGHNKPPKPTLEELLDPEMLVEQWKLDYEALFAKADALKTGFDRFQTASAGGIQTEEQAEKATAFCKQLKAQAKLVEGIRTQVKAPFSTAASAADATFKRGVSDVLSDLAKKVEDALTLFQRRKAEAERKRREDEARKAREEADRIAAQALKSGSADLLETATQADDKAQKAEVASNARDTEMARTRSTIGGVATFRDNWTFEVLDLAAVPREWLMLDESKVRAAIKAKANQVREIPGLRIFNDQKSVVI